MYNFVSLLYLVQTLTKLNLSENEIEVDGAQSISQALKINKVK